MTVDKLIEKLKEFDGSLEVQSIEYADSNGCGCCGSIEYEYATANGPYIDTDYTWFGPPGKQTKRLYTVVRIDAR